MLTTRGLTAADIDLVCRHREEMFRISNTPGRTEEVLRTMTLHFRAWLTPRLADGSYFGFILEEDGNPVAGIGLMMIDWPPHPSHPSQDKRGYVLNVFVESDYRGRGLGKFLMDTGEAELIKRGISFAILHATQMGVPLYERLGWSKTSEMSKFLG
jgi:ribosomal protein S18 acetylase RimI-like enzyme